MRGGNLASGRKAYYDRNLIAQLPGTYQATGIGPHALTTRQTYSQGSTSRGIIDSLGLAAIRASAATTTGKTKVVFSDANGQILIVAQFNNLTLGTADRTTGGVGTILAGTDSVTLATSDASTGGTVDYDAGFSFQNFDN